MACNISMDTGSFLTLGLLSIRLKPSSTDWTNGDSVGDSIPAILCTHASACTTSSTADLECLAVLRCCIYSARCIPFTGKVGTISIDSAHTFHLWNAPRYFLVVLSALPLSTTSGNPAASCCSSGFCRSRSNGQSPAENTSIWREGKHQSQHNYPPPPGVHPDHIAQAVLINLLLMPSPPDYCLVTAGHNWPPGCAYLHTYNKCLVFAGHTYRPQTARQSSVTIML